MENVTTTIEPTLTDLIINSVIPVSRAKVSSEMEEYMKGGHDYFFESESGNN